MSTPLNHESSAVHCYLSLLQDVISRMAGSAASCKKWCVTLVSALAVVLVETDKSEHVTITLIPIVFFLFLDAFFLGLERHYIDRYNKFTQDLKNSVIDPGDLFDLDPGGWKIGLKGIFGALLSVGTIPFYSLMALLMWGVSQLTT